jgi:cell division protein FtsN
VFAGRSKTADIERMLHINRPDTSARQSASTPTTTSGVSNSSLDSKKYTKRRYTDSRHQTRHIPDAESLSSQTTTSKLSSTSRHTSMSTSAPNTSTTTSSSTAGAPQPVWKRRELISSAPKQRGTFF